MTATLLEDAVRRTVLMLVVTVLVAAGLTGCSGPKPPTGGSDVAPPVADPTTSTRLAPGLYDIEGGRVQALGTLEFRDLEGGFWVVVGGTQAEGDFGKTVAVIANGDALKQQLDALKGQSVSVLGTRAEGASIRMAGPEIVAETVEAVTDTPGPAE